MSKICKIGILAILLFGIWYVIMMFRFAEGVKEDALNKKNEIPSQVEGS